MKIPIVDENDNLIKYIEREEVELEKSLIYRVSYLWAVDTNDNILLAQRSFNKKHNPGKWGPAVAGTVEENETYESNIIKEIEEEIGLKGVKLEIGRKERRRGDHNYFAQEFLLKLPYGFNDFKIQKNEVEQLKWFSVEELKKELNEHPEMFLSMIKERLK